MMRLNNKGQSLVMFVVLIPVFLLIITLVFDIGNGIYEKERISNVNYMTVKYGLQKLDKVSESDLILLIMENTDDLDNISVYIDGESINIKIDKNIEGIIGGVFGFDVIEIRSEYEGKIVNGKEKIERIK